MSSNLDAFFYMTLGDEPDLEPNFSRMESIFEAAAPDNFTWVAERDASKSHMTTRLVGQYEGLVRFFAEQWPLSQQDLTAGGHAGLESHLEQLSLRYGYPVLYNEQVFQASAQRSLSQRDYPAATGFARLYARQYETSPVAHFLLGVSLARGGEREAAAAEIDTAINLYESDPQPEQQAMYETMKRVQQQLAGAGQQP